MRSICVLISILLLPAAWAVAQYNGADNDAPYTASPAVVTGCLDVTAGNYTLTDPSGSIYQLTGKTNKLKGHVGETIQVKGVSSGIVNVPGSMSEGTETQPTLSVVSFRRVSSVCSNDVNNLP